MGAYLFISPFCELLSGAGTRRSRTKAEPCEQPAIKEAEGGVLVETVGETVQLCLGFLVVLVVFLWVWVFFFVLVGVKSGKFAFCAPKDHLNPSPCSQSLPHALIYLTSRCFSLTYGRFSSERAGTTRERTFLQQAAGFCHKNSRALLRSPNQITAGPLAPSPRSILGSICLKTSSASSLARTSNPFQ